LSSKFGYYYCDTSNRRKDVIPIEYFKSQMIVMKFEDEGEAVLTSIMLDKNNIK